MVENSSLVPLKSDVLVAPYHGSDMANSRMFIQSVAPRYVIFSAGSRYQHPRAIVAERYWECEVSPRNMFRTDRGDNEGGREWSLGDSDSSDLPGDDDVDILILDDGQVVVAYSEPDSQR